MTSKLISLTPHCKNDSVVNVTVKHLSKALVLPNLQQVNSNVLVGKTLVSMYFSNSVNSVTLNKIEAMFRESATIPFLSSENVRMRINALSIAVSALYNVRVVMSFVSNKSVTLIVS